MAVTGGQKVTSFSKSPDGSTLAVGGREVFNLIELNPFRLKANLRNRLVMKQGAQTMAYAVQATKWHPKNPNLISTISPTGAIVLWKLGERPTSDMVEYHSRVGTSVSWSHFDPNLLFSTSHDSSKKLALWDVREFGKDSLPKGAPVLPANSVCKEVVCSPLRQHTVVVSTDSGIMHLLDTRRMSSTTAGGTSSSVRDICAHSSSFTIDWHPQVSDALCTGSNDHWLHVWDLSRASNEPLHKIQTIANVSRVQWRPSGAPSVTSTSFATTSMLDQDIRVWDVNTPFAPVVCFKKAHTETIADFIWLKSDEMLSCSMDGVVKVQHIKMATLTHDKPNTCVTWLNPSMLVTVRSVVETHPSEDYSNPPFVNMTHFSLPQTAPVFPSHPPAATSPPPAAGDAPPVGLFRRLLGTRGTQHHAATPAPSLLSPQTLTTVSDSPDGFMSTSFPTPNTLPSTPSQSVRSVVEVVGVGLESQKATATFKKYAMGYALPTMKGFSFHKEAVKDLIDHNAAVAQQLGDYTVEAVWKSLQIANTCSDKTLCSELLHAYLDCYSDQGDVQQCAYLYITLVASGGVQVAEEYRSRAIEWILTYVEQLDQLRLNVVSTAIVRSCCIPAVHDALQPGLLGAETFRVICSCGGKATADNRCSNCCGLMNMCAICENETKGLFVWFRTCGHGGCQEHVWEWLHYCKERNEAALCPKCATPLF